MEELLSKDAAVHQETLQLLAEAAEYLGRLPLHHLTLGLKSKIDAHLQRPDAKAHQARLERVARDQEWRTRLDAGECFTGCASYTPSGVPLIDCLVVDGILHLRSPAASRCLEDSDKWASAIGREVAAGVRIQLNAMDKDNVFDRRTLSSWQPLEGKNNEPA